MTKTSCIKFVPNITKHLGFSIACTDWRTDKQCYTPTTSKGCHISKLHQDLDVTFICHFFVKLLKCIIGYANSCVYNLKCVKHAANNIMTDTNTMTMTLQECCKIGKQSWQHVHCVVSTPIYNRPWAIHHLTCVICKTTSFSVCISDLNNFLVCKNIN